MFDYAPSGFARRTIDDSALTAYRGAGDELGLDWAILAAADEILGSPGPGGPAESAKSIGYSLLAMGAPADYEVALEAHAGPGVAPRVLARAERFRGRPPGQSGAVPSESAPLSLPAEGEVVAPFGRGYGLLHDGVDIDADTGEPVRAVASGIVVSTGYTEAYGNYTCVVHRLVPAVNGSSRITSCFGNQSAFEAKAGERVERGEVIGRVGCSGPCLRPHVHFQILRGSGPDGEAIDPAPFMGGALPAGSGGASLEGREQ